MINMLFVPCTKMVIAVALTITLQELTKFSTLANEMEHNNSSFWWKVSRIFVVVLEKCIPNKIRDHTQAYRNDNAVEIIKDCLKRKGLQAIDRAMRLDVIQITDNVVLVKQENNYSKVDRRHDRLTDLQKQRSSGYLDLITDWNHEFMNRIEYFLKTRIVRITFKGINTDSDGRGRKQNSFGQMMMFGLVAAGFIVIPLGFQFLAVLGGKALLLAKLALILTSIQGLKKIATSQVNYGLYSTGHGGPWHYDRHWHHETDPYSSTLHSSNFETPILDYFQPSVLPPTYDTYPRREDI